jgi:hypothetical protein
MDFSSKSILLELILQNTKTNELLIGFIPEVQPEGLQAVADSERLDFLQSWL